MRLFRIIKGFVLWSYARNTWQYDVLCVLILAFIFLTPKAWWQTSELKNKPASQRPAITTILIAGQRFAEKPSNQEAERVVRAATGRATASVIAVREVLDAGGGIVAYEVDIK